LNKDFESKAFSRFRVTLPLSVIKIRINRPGPMRNVIARESWDVLESINGPTLFHAESASRLDWRVSFSEPCCNRLRILKPSESIERA
jgi:hypothetical protein